MRLPAGYAKDIRTNYPVAGNSVLTSRCRGRGEAGAEGRGWEPDTQRVVVGGTLDRS